jgi:hypothetical protein
MALLQRHTMQPGDSAGEVLSMTGVAAGSSNHK